MYINTHDFSASAAMRPLESIQLMNKQDIYIDLDMG